MSTFSKFLYQPTNQIIYDKYAHTRTVHESTLLDTFKYYGELATRESGLFDSIISAGQTAAVTIIQTLGKVLDFVKKRINSIVQLATEWLVNTIIDAALRATSLRIWQLFTSIVNGIITAITENPALCTIAAYRFLFTTSTTERLACLVALVPDRTIAEFVELLVTPINAIRESSNDIFFSSLISKLFCLSSFPMLLSKLLLVLREFNTCMTGWKNIHSLVENLIQYLPTCITKIFTITDPQKRYQVDAQTPGNKVYDMIQSYINLVQGENCASPSAYASFQKTWKEAEEYITKEYAPNTRVFQLHQHYRTCASAIMRPGTHGAKPIPFVLTLYGPPGTGKSTSWPLLISAITGGTMSQIRSLSYTRNPDATHFDGYNPEEHKVFVYDDFGSQVDDASAGELMAIVSNADFLPPYASLSDPSVGIKGTSFSSPIVILCTNFSNFDHCKQIADKVALKRRLGICVNLDRKWAPPTYGPNGEMLSEGTKYTVTRSKTDGTQEPIMREDNTNYYNMTQLQHLLAAEYKKHYDGQIQITNEFDKFLAKPTIESFTDMFHHVQQTISARREAGDDYFDANEELTIPNEFPELEVIQTPTPLEKIKTLGFYTLCTFTFTQRFDSSFLPKLAALIAGFGLAYYIISKYFTTTYGQHESGEAHLARNNQSRHFARAARVNYEKSVHEQGNTVYFNTTQKIMQNLVTLIDMETGHYVHALFVCGRIAVTVKHFLKYRDTFELFTRRSVDTSTYTVNKSECKIEYIRDTELAIIEFPPQLQEFKSLMSIIRRGMVPKKPTPAFTTRIDVRSGIVAIHNTTLEKGSYPLEFDEETGDITHSILHLKYEADHRAGDCGNPVIAEIDGGLFIVGIHEAGLTSSRTCFATQLERTELEEYLKKFSPSAQISRDDFHYETAKYEQGEYGPNKTSYVATCEEHIVAPGKTDLHPSILHDVIQPHTMIPALLRPTKEHDPMVKALNKYGLCTDQFPQEYIDNAVMAISEDLQALKSDEDIRRKLTISEALNGIPGKIESVDLSTSSGYPFSLKQETKGPKRKVIDGEPGSLTLSMIAQENYDYWQRCLENNIIPSDPFLATLKDEKRKIEKVKAGKTRVFCAGNLSGFLHNKQLFAGFCEFMTRTRASTFSTLGLDRASKEWHQLITEFKNISPYGLDGDQEEWDGRFKSTIALACVKIINDFYGDEFSNHRLICFMQAVFPYLRITWNYGQGLKSTIIQIPGCMPSGWYLTFVVNSLVNAVLMRIAWQMLVSKPMNDLHYYRRYVREKYAGDDSFLAVHPDFLHEFNNIEIARVFAKYGQKYTPASKSGDLIPYQKIEDCVFLKTKTGMINGFYVPLFDMDANLETLNWIRKNKELSDFELTEANANDVLRNLIFYGQPTFDKYRAMILKHQPTMNLLHFQPLMDAYLEAGSIPDPTGAFGFSRNLINRPQRLYDALMKINAQ